MERRSFLKLCAAAFAGATIPGVKASDQLSLIEGSQTTTSQWVGTVREIIAYDLHSDIWIARYDVLGKETQLTVSFYIKDDKHIKESREQATQMLKARMDELGISASDLKPLPIPEGIRATAFEAWS